MVFSLEDRRDDPLMDNLLAIEGVSGFVEVQTEKTFQLDYSQYIELVRASYNAVNTIDKEFGKNLSFGAFQYYCTVLLWKRLYFILSERGLKTSESARLDELLNFNLAVPSDVKLYLQGIGDLKDHAGNEFILDIQGTLSELKINNALGSYGKIDAQNCIIYETLPSLLISLLKMRADLSSGENSNWDLPPELKPSISKSWYPTRNLLGWWRTESMTYNQRLMLTNAGINNNTFNVENVGFLPINKSLLKFTSEKLEKSKMSLDKMPCSTYGSIAQIAFITRVSEDTKIDDMKNIAGKLGRTNSYIQMPGNIASAAATFRYRIKRREYNEADMLAYMFYGNEIPNDVLGNANQIFEFGVGGKLWNKSEFRISEQDGRGLITSFSLRLRKFPEDKNK